MIRKLLQKLILVILVVPVAYSCTQRSEISLLTTGNDSILLTSSDTFLVSLFNWARTTSLGYTGSDSDPAGPWYEAALPAREAFCIRDVSHQCIGAEIIGLGRQNLNMFRKFVGNISEEKDFCSYWEINRYNKPAPVDYLSDHDFWYNLNANFDIIDACYKLYQWTGDSTYISDPVFDNFFRLTLGRYIEKWQLEPGKIMKRPSFMNLTKETKKFRSARGIPSYDEAQEDIRAGSDLLGMIYSGFRTYSLILKLKNENQLSLDYGKMADKYLHLIDSAWWNQSTATYHGFYKTDGKFYSAVNCSQFLLWYKVVTGRARIEKSLDDLINSQVELLSYLPMLFYRYGRNEEAYNFLLKIYADKRREYPEASGGAIEGVIRGLMGIEPSAAENLVTTCPKLTHKTDWITIENIRVLNHLISVCHKSSAETVFANKSGKDITWRAMFPGSAEEIYVDGKPLAAHHIKDEMENTLSFVDVAVKGNTQSKAEAVSIKRKVN